MSHKLTQASGLGIIALTCLLRGSAAAQDVEESAPGVATEQRALHGHASAVLRDAKDGLVGRIVFTAAHHSTVVIVTANLPAGMDGIHGLHVHLGAECIADPTQSADTHFVSAGGHYNPGGGTHGNHAGDMPALFFTEDGKAAMTFITDRFTPDEIRGKAVILHAAPDNYGNVPVGAAANQYSTDRPAAITLTQNTGNAGNRIACGVIR